MRLTMPQIGENVTSTVLPSTKYTLRTDYVRTKDIPALYSILALDEAKNGEDGTDGSLFTPLDRLFTEQNEDGTFAVRSDLALIAPEARFSAASFVETTIVTFDTECRRDEVNLKKMLAQVVGVRQSRCIKLVAIDCLKGKLDDLVKLYADDDSNPRYFGSLAKLLCFDQLKRSTYQAKRKELFPSDPEPPEQESKSSSATKNERRDSQEQSDAEPPSHAQPEKVNNHNDDPGEQYELFQDDEDEDDQ